MSTNESFPLCEKKVVATGKLKNYTRNALVKLLKDLGAFPTHRVSNKTDILIVGSKPGSKLEKARDLGTSILSEVELEIMLSQYGISPESTINKF